MVEGMLARIATVTEACPVAPPLRLIRQLPVSKSIKMGLPIVPSPRYPSQVCHSFIPLLPCLCCNKTVIILLWPPPTHCSPPFYTHKLWLPIQWCCFKTNLHVWFLLYSAILNLRKNAFTSSPLPSIHYLVSLFNCGMIDRIIEIFFCKN